MTEPLVRQLPETPGLPHRLGRSIHHDPRSRAYAFRTSTEVQLNSVYWERAVPIFDQGDLGSCTGNAAAGWLGTANALRSGLASARDGSRVDETYAVQLYERATQLDPFDGTYPPTDTGSDGLSVTKALQEAGFVDSYQHAFSVGAALAALQSGPVLIGTAWHQGMFNPGPRAVVTVTGPVVGGHEYLAVGYDAGRREVTFANSWGTGWGDAGYFRMTADTLAALLDDDGDATIPHALVTAPTPEPTPPPAPPTPGDAGWFQLDPVLVARVAHAAARHDLHPQDWLNKHLRTYFDER